jgi:hypothetical protein
MGIAACYTECNQLRRLVVYHLYSSPRSMPERWIRARRKETRPIRKIVPGETIKINTSRSRLQLVAFTIVT